MNHDLRNNVVYSYLRTSGIMDWFSIHQFVTNFDKTLMEKLKILSKPLNIAK